VVVVCHVISPAISRGISGANGEGFPDYSPR
jgi:hypothetical protein